MNSVRGNEVGAPLAHATDPILAQLTPPRVGDLVMTIDEEGNRCGAYVKKATDKWVRLELNPALWVPGLDYRETSSPAPTVQYAQLPGREATLSPAASVTSADPRSEFKAA